VSPVGSNVALHFSTGTNKPAVSTPVGSATEPSTD
jgi:hypothetical protein